MPNKKKSALKAKAEHIKTKSRARIDKIKSARSMPTHNTVTDNRLELLITTVNRSKTEFYLDLLQSFDVNMQCVVMARGTANESTLELLGLSDSEKVVILSVVQENRIPDLLSALGDKFNSIKDGKGVAWTVPLTSVIGTLIYGFLSNNRETVKETK